ncbi:MAG: DUF934 domain-containing protein [Hyphomonadaceae bacterium]
MPLLKNGKVEQDAWTFAEDGVAPSDGGPVIVSFARFLAEHDVLLACNHPIGVRLANSDDPGQLAPWLDRLSLIELAFPKYTDGSAFSQAQLLRRRYGFKGEIRATGQILRDQLRLMIRSGFDAIQFDDADAEAVYEISSRELSEFYQPAADTSASIFLKRHSKV